MFGALGGVLPVRLGGTPQNGWTAEQHARFCADLTALHRVQPLATWLYEQTGSGVDDAEIFSYAGRNGVGLAHAPSAVPDSVGVTDFAWAASQWLDPYTDDALAPVAKAVVATVGSAGRYATADLTSDRSVRVRVRSHSGANIQLVPVTVTVWGTIVGLQTRTFGDYGGDPNKHDSETEGRAPYAEFLLREFQSQRGTAYTKEQATLVDVENVALARFYSASGPRLAEKFRKNCQPATSDERLPYWEQVLAVPKKPGEPKWRTRQKLAAAYMISRGATNESVRAALTALLGDVFVDMSWSQGASLSVPPTQTFWPTINPGDPSLSLGGGAWTSERNVLVVTVQRPSSMTLGDFFSLLDVDMFQMLDQMLPAWAGFSYTIQAAVEGFIFDESMFDFTRFSE